jgi:protein ImuA
MREGEAINAWRNRALVELRARLTAVAHPHMAEDAVLPFGLPMMDEVLPWGGMPRAALHEVGGESDRPADEAAASLFAAGIVARLEGPVLWATGRRDLFAPALAQAGLAPDRAIYVETGRDENILAAMEDGLRQPGLAGVVGEIGKLGMTASRRLQLAAASSGVMALALRRRPVAGLEPTAAVTRWSIAAHPSSPLPVPGIGRARWQVQLARCRGGKPADWIMEACDETGRLACPAALADRPAAPERQIAAA